MVGLTGVMFIGVKTYQEAPPRPNFSLPNGDIAVTHDEIVDGQGVFQKYALMNYGSMFGDGAGRGNDFTAEALHVWSVGVKEYYHREIGRRQADTTQQKLSWEQKSAYAQALCVADMKKTATTKSQTL